MSEIVQSSLKTTVKGTALAFFGIVASILLWFATKVLIVRSITKEELGIYSIAVAVGGILSVFASLGIQDGVSRFISIFLGESKEEEAASISKAAIRVGLLSGIFFFLSLYFLSGVIAQHIFYKPGIERAIRIMSLFVPCSVMATIIGGIFRGHNVLTPKVLLIDIGQPFILLVLVFFSSALSLPFISIVYAYVGAMAVVCLLLGIYFIGRLRLNPFSRLEGAHGSDLIRFSSPLLVATILGIVLSWCDTIMLGRYSVTEEVGVYSIGMSLAKLLIFPLGALEFAYMPIAGELYVRKQLSELNKTYQTLTKWNFAVTLPIFFILFFFPETTITFFFGERFVDSSATLRILSVCFLFHAFLGANGILMIVMGRSRDLMNVSIFGTLLNILLNYVFIKILGYGSVGASCATLFSYFALNIIMSLILYRISGINPLTAGYLKPIAGSVLAGLSIYALAKILPLYYWMLPVYFILFVAGYGVSLVLTGSLSPEDASLIDAVVIKTGLEMEWLRRLVYRLASGTKGETSL